MSNPRNRPTPECHLALARQNLAGYADAMTPARWRVVMLFYAALHQVSAVACKEGVSPRRHVDRADWLYERSQLIGDRYEQLRSASETARYQPGHFPYSDGQISHPQGHLYRQLYQPIASWSAKLVGHEAILVPIEPKVVIPAATTR